MSNGLPKHTRRLPVWEEDELSSRDQVLSRVESLLSERGLPPFPGQEEEETGPPDLVNLTAIVEIAKLPPSVTRPAPPPPPRPDDSNLDDEDDEDDEPPTRRWSLVASVVQSFILLFVLTWVFIFGILIGRGQLLESGLGHDMVVWLEREFRGQGDGPDISDGHSPSRGGAPLQPPSDLKPNGQRLTPSASRPAPPPPQAVSTPTPPPPRETAPGQSGSPQARLVENVILDWAGRQWFAEEAARRREAEPLAQGLEGDEDFQIEVEPPIPSAVTAPPAAAQTAASPPQTDQAAPSPAPPGQPAGAAPAAADQAAAGVPGRFAVQVALVYDQDEAQRRVERLEKFGFTAYFYQGAGDRLPVRVGHFTTRQAAEEALARLKTLGYSGAYISTLGN